MSAGSSATDKRHSLHAFCRMPCIKYWRSQLNSSNIKNLKTKARQGGTKKCYTYGLFNFHKWLCGKQFEHASIQTDNNIVNVQKSTVVIRGIDHFLDLYQQNTLGKTEFVMLVKKYLIHLQTTKNASTIDNAAFAIKSFFRENDSEIIFRFNNTKRRYDQTVDDAMTLNDIRTILSIKTIQAIEKAVFMCKFHRGLDSATLADRFNFDAWQQIVDYFGTDDPNMWDVSKCPVPVKLIRVKTNYLHTGFLGADAIAALREYLKIRAVAKDPPSNSCHITRGTKTDTRIRGLRTGEALFLDTSGNPISINWIGRRFAKLRKRSSVGKTYSSHEMRDLLKSTLIDSGCRPDVADHVIGHVPKDTYEKQSLLYPESLRTEFAKASDRINVLSLTKQSKACKKLGTEQDDQRYVLVEASLIDELIRANRQVNELLLQIEQNRACLSNLHIRKNGLFVVNDSYESA